MISKRIESYNSSYPLSYYEIGTVYSFYGQKNTQGNPATADQIRRFSGVLKNLENAENSNAIRPVKSRASAGLNSTLNRFYAVVVDKKRKSSSSIQVMFINRDDRGESFLVRSYAVGFGCSTDGKDLMPVSTSTNINTVHRNPSKVGGITRSRSATEDKKVGGITRAKQVDKKSSSIGGITRINKGNPPQSNSTSAENSRRVGGITRARR